MGNAIGGRKEPGEYWRDAVRKWGDVVKDSENKIEKVFWVYDDGDAKLTEEKSFVKDFATKEEKEKPFEVDFEPRPNLSVYND